MHDCVIHVGLCCWIKQKKSQADYWYKQLSTLQRQTQATKILNQELAQYKLALQQVKQIEIERNASLHFFNQLAQLTPEGIVFTEVSRRGSLIALSGSTPSSNIFTQFMQHFARAQLVEIKTQTNSAQLKFQFQVMQDENPVQSI